LAEQSRFMSTRPSRLERMSNQPPVAQPKLVTGAFIWMLSRAQKVAESLFAKYIRIALAIFRKFDDSFGYAVAGVKTAPVAASHRCAMPIATSAPAVASATEIARAKRSIFSSSHRDIARSPAPGPHFPPRVSTRRPAALPSGPYKQEPRSGRGLGLGD
jgi:hypothetical protein